MDDSLQALRLGDLIEKSFQEGKVKLQDAICNECFEKIFKRLDGKVKDQEDEKKKYAEQLVILEDEI